MNNSPHPSRAASLVAQIALVATVLASSCAPHQSDDQAVKDILRTIEYVEPPATRWGGTIQTKECEVKIWSGPNTEARTATNPVLGVYAKGGTSVATDNLHLTKGDLGVAIEKDLLRRGVDRSGPQMVGSASSFSNTSIRASQLYYFVSTDLAKKELVKAPVILRSIVQGLGQPRYAYNSQCEGTIVLLYGDAAYPYKDAHKFYGLSLENTSGSPKVSPVKSRSDQCQRNRRFIEVIVNTGQYAVLNKDKCHNG